MREAISKLDPEEFEELCKELLRLDGFTNVQLHGKGQDQGVDLTAVRNYAIAHGREHRISWCVQCKHPSSGRSLGRDIVNQILYDFDTQAEFQGLIIITSTKLSAPALTRITEYVKQRNRPVFHWDITDIEHFVIHHPFLIERFRLDIGSQVLRGASSIRVLLLSDGSVFAYHVHHCLRSFGFQVRESRLHHYGSDPLPVMPEELGEHFDLIIVFLAELYWMPVPGKILTCLHNNIEQGLRVLFTPFCAWSVEAGLNPGFEAMLPVRVKEGHVDLLRLLLPDPPEAISAESLGLPGYTDTFIENQLISFETKPGRIFSSQFHFKGRSTYEFLEVKEGAQCLLADNYENPVLAIQDIGKGETGYLNMCAHNCLTLFSMKSPLEGHEQLARVIAEFALWLARKDKGTAPPGADRLIAAQIQCLHG